MPVFGPLRWEAPRSVQEAVKFAMSDRSKVMAGGTGVYELAKKGMIGKTETLIDLMQLGLDYFDEEPAKLRIGATCTIAKLLKQSAITPPGLLGLRDAASKVKPAQVRNAATVGGAVSISIPFLDLPPAFLAHDAVVKISGPSKERSAPVGELWLDYLLPSLKPGEIVTELEVPKPGSRSGSAFMKIGRTAADFALVNACAKLDFDGDGRCKAARVAMGGIASVAKRVRSAETGLEGKKLAMKDVLAAASTLGELKPPPPPVIHGSSWYKVEIGKLLIRDTVLLAARRAGEPIAE